MDAKVQERPVTLVWIDARTARIVRWFDDEARIERLESDVPAHRRSSGHVEHDPAIRPGGGGGRAATAGEPHRHEHLRQFLALVASRLPEGDLEVTGPGTTHEHLARVLRDAGPPSARRIESIRSGPRTDPQLVARLRQLVGHEPIRRGPSSRAGPGPRGRRALVGRERGTTR